MTELKQEAFTLIARLPEGKEDVLISVVKSLREALGMHSQSRAEKNTAIIKEMKNLIGNDIPWTSEEEMIRELAETRRQKSKL